jgi:hypothetical protein
VKGEGVSGGGRATANEREHNLWIRTLVLEALRVVSLRSFDAANVRARSPLLGRHVAARGRAAEVGHAVRALPARGVGRRSHDPPSDGAPLLVAIRARVQLAVRSRDLQAGRGVDGQQADSRQLQDHDCPHSVTPGEQEAGDNTGRGGGRGRRESKGVSHQQTHPFRICNAEPRRCLTASARTRVAGPPKLSWRLSSVYATWVREGGAGAMKDGWAGNGDETFDKAN